MPRPTIVEQNYFEFKVALQQATDAGRRIEQKEKDRWKSWHPYGSKPSAGSVHLLETH